MTFSGGLVTQVDRVFVTSKIDHCRFEPFAAYQVTVLSASDYWGLCAAQLKELQGVRAMAFSVAAAEDLTCSIQEFRAPMGSPASTALTILWRVSIVGLD